MGWGEFVVFAAAGFLGGFTFLMATDFALLDRAWCISSERHCVREWIGALSGWAAAFAAGSTIFVLLRQLGELRRQREFALGEMWPTAHIEDSDGNAVQDMFMCQLVVTNWNRQPILVDAVSLTEPDDADLARIERRLKEGGVYVEYKDTEPLFVAGWTNRSGPPPQLILKLLIAEFSDSGDFEFRRRAVSVTCHVTLISSRYETRELEANSPRARVY